MSLHKYFAPALVALLLLPSLALAFGQVRQADRDLNVRNERNLTAKHVRTLKKGEKVRTDFMKDGWVAVFELGETKRDESLAIGYSNAKYLNVVEQAQPASDSGAKPQKGADGAKARPGKVGVGKTGKSATSSAPAPKASKAVLAQRTGKENISGDMPEQAAVPSTPPAPAKAEIKGKVAPAPEEPAKATPHAQGAPVKITADRMVYDDADGTVSFEGSVKATHSSLSLWSSKITAYFAKEQAGDGDPAQNVDRILATGGVRMSYQDRVKGNCERLVYTVKTGILRMQGDPVLTDGPNNIRGQEIRFYLKDKRSEVVGGKGKRVEATFITPEDFETP